ncbi:hypothetical protein HN415_02420 [Candidatus Woesearchaeota archaeon]|jgi:uncharacterized protein|nr:hypothetical protein [Candidatus Woesearchaeota archaeon]
MNIGFDIDSVLLLFEPFFRRFHNEKYGTNLITDDLKDYNLSIILGVSQKIVSQRVFEFYNSHQFDEMTPVKGSKEVIYRLKEYGHKLHILTARPHEINEKTKDQIEKHYGIIFDSYNYFPSTNHNGDTKAFYCYTNGIDVLIEDNWDEAQRCCKLGIQSIIFNPLWNEGKKSLLRGRIVNNWSLAEEKLEEISKGKIYLPKFNENFSKEFTFQY